MRRALHCHVHWSQAKISVIGVLLSKVEDMFNGQSLVPVDFYNNQYFICQTAQHWEHPQLRKTRNSSVLSERRRSCTAADQQRAWYLGSSWKTQFKNWYCVKPSQSLQDVKASRSGARKPSELVCFCCLSVAVLVTVTGTFRVNGSQHIFSLSFWNST